MQRFLGNILDVTRACLIINLLFSKNVLGVARLFVPTCMQVLDSQMFSLVSTSSGQSGSI